MKDPRPLSERFDLTYVRRRTWPGNWTFKLSVLLALAAGVYVAAMALRGDQRPYSAGALTQAHAMFGKDCSQCHQPDPRRSGYWLPVTDEACLNCHVAAAHPDPHGALFAGPFKLTSGRLGAIRMAGQCSACHVEHEGLEHDLNRVPDHFCIKCHANLPAYLGSSSEATAIKDSIRSFNGDHPNWGLLDGKHIDKTPLRFEHQVHMDPATPQMQKRIREWIDELTRQGYSAEQIPVAVLHADEVKKNGESAATLTLACVACHQLDEGGGYMEAISFEQHCQPCHDLGTRSGELVPHGSVIGAFVDQLAARQVLFPPPPASAPAAGPRKGGPKSGPRAAPPATAPAVTFESEKALTEALAKRVSAKRDDLLRGLKNACSKCHGIETEVNRISDPHIPTLWLHRSRFNHQAHLFVDCTRCHAEAGLPAKQAAANPEETEDEGYPGEDDPKSPASQLRWAGHTRDIMIPPIQTCRECHKPDLAGDACAQCHVYHAR